MNGILQVSNRFAALCFNIFVLAGVLSCFVSVVVVIVGCIDGVGGGGSL